MTAKNTITTTGIFDYFARIRGNSPALKFNDIQYTFSEWDQQSTRLSEALAERGVGVGDRVAVLAYNRIEHFVVLFATMKLGAVFVPVNYRLSPNEIKYILNQSESKVLFTDDDELCAKVDSIIEDVCPETMIRFDVQKNNNGWESYSQFMASTPKVNVEPCHSPSQPVYQMYTSGTTGFPKGVLITQSQLATFMFHNILTPSRVDVGLPHLVVAPLFHAAGFVGALSSLCCGRPVVILRDFDPVKFVETLAHENISDVTLVPAMLHAILQYVPNIESYDFSNLKKIIYGGSPITADLLQRSMNVFKCEFQQAFGMTEAVASVTCLTTSDHKLALEGKPELLQSCGRPGAFVEVKIVDSSTRTELEAGEIGEIAVKAPYLMLGYSKEPDKTKEVLENGWYYTGDGGYLDGDGYLYIKDRIKDMIISGGENVYPTEVENVLISHPGIQDVAVVGCPDQRWGEAVVAVCVPSDGEAPGDEDVIEFCRSKLASYKIPRRYVYQQSLPRNPSGKLLKKNIRESLVD